MAAKWPAFNNRGPKGAKLDNETSHNFTDPNKGGGPAAPVVRNAKRVPDAHRGGPYQPGQRQYASASIHGGRGSAGNPASRGNVSPVGRQSSPSETRVPGHGGSPQMRTNIPPPAHRGGFGHSGQVGVPGVRTNPQPGAGNTAGRMSTRIAGRFKNNTKGARATGTVGNYGDRAPISANT